MLLYERMSRKFLIAANWKMNIPPVEAFTDASPFRSIAGADVWVFPSFLDLHSAREHGLIVGAQYGRADAKGSFTGDVSMQMLADQHYHAVLCGHSERRKNHGETDAMVLVQATAAISAGLIPIVCVGETESERTTGRQEEVVKRQLSGLPQDVILAYEPVWAIGTGKSTTPEDAQHMHAFIRSILPKKETVILYGGSMNGKNCENLLSQPDIDGGLIGAASLKPDDFRIIVETAARLSGK